MGRLKILALVSIVIGSGLTMVYAIASENFRMFIYGVISSTVGVALYFDWASEKKSID